MEFIQEPKELGFTLEPLVVFYGIFIPCAILSTQAGKQRLTFLLDRQFFCFAALRPRFHDLSEKLVRFRIRLTSFFLLFTESSKQRWTFFLDKQFFLRCASTSFSRFGRRISTISHSPNLLFPSFEVKIFQLTSVSWFCL